MCRFLAYKGKRTLLADILTRPYHSLIKQSYRAKMREEPLNGDGFGVGWYDPELDEFPGLFTSLVPAWSNRNLHRIAEKLSSPCVFAHIRAATPGLLVEDVNCHPFQHKKLLWMHNGFINEFIKIKRTLRASLKDEFYHMIEGTTDSEHAFAVFLNFLPEGKADYSLAEMKEAMLKTIKQINDWTEEVGVTGRSNYNFAVTDGYRMVVTRYATHTDKIPESLYYTKGSHFKCAEGVCHMVDSKTDDGAVIISSEPLTEEVDEWTVIEPNTLVTIDESNKMEFTPITD
ncbi:MAG: class II glutamine amidotransferase [Chlamydiota bacterium]|nr:class II glutamine amidotransferase [Chlamydiota bacterium]